MEVHHHAHTARKKWTHYLWEFLMLFLAVFCGFLAENKREHLVEYNKAKAYARSLFKDLQSDTADINRAYIYEGRAVMMIDSLLHLAGDPDKKFIGGQLYYYARFSTWTYGIDWNKATLDQLINSGTLRYFTNNELVTLISEYNTTSNLIKEMQNAIDGSRLRAIGYRDQILKAFYSQNFISITMDDLLQGRRSIYIDSLRKIDFPLQSNDPALMNGLLNGLLGTKTNRQILSSKFFPRAIVQAGKIMELLKEEYNIK